MLRSNYRENLGLGWFAPHCFLGKKTWVSRIAAQIHGTDKWHSWRRKPAYWLQSQKFMSQCYVWWFNCKPQKRFSIYLCIMCSWIFSAVLTEQSRAKKYLWSVGSHEFLPFSSQPSRPSVVGSGSRCPGTEKRMGWSAEAAWKTGRIH